MEWTEGAFKKSSNTRNLRPMNSKAKLQAWGFTLFYFILYYLILFYFMMTRKSKMYTYMEHVASADKHPGTTENQLVTVTSTDFNSLAP